MDTTTAPPPSDPAAVYQERTARFAAERDRVNARWNGVANLRLLTFVAALIAGGVGLWQGMPLLTWAGGALLVGFVALVKYHNILDVVRLRAAELWAINAEAAPRLARDWPALPVRHAVRADPTHPYAADLDLLGPASLFLLLDAGSTPMGEATLSRWLLAPAPPASVRARQAAVAELAPLLDLRDDLALQARLSGSKRADPAPFLAWAESAPWLAERRGLYWAACASVALLWIFMLASLTGVLPYPIWLLFVASNLGFQALLGGRARQVLEEVDAREGALRQYAESLRLLSAAPFQAAALRDLQSDLTAHGHSAHYHVMRVYRLARRAFPQDSMLYLPVQLLMLWDVHVLAALEGWQQAAGRRVRAWLATLGEAEALAGLARLAYDNPGWTFPVLDPAPLVTGRALGHPLLPAGERVVNDVEVGPPGTFLLVTGSNMSGKSTLLRAIGVNLVLANAGGPVCAAALRLPPVTLATSMRVQDSLTGGVSFFMAELQRLKGIVDAARAAAAGGERRLLYLLDEILQGTNTAERQIAARRVILYLVAAGALGAVSTHDLTLADSPAMAAAARLIHFTETVAPDGSGPAMSFDYKIRPGLATSTNALRLMKLIGLTLDEEIPAETPAASRS